MIDGFTEEYLSAKRELDDRSLNGKVWSRFGDELRDRDEPRILEVGSGTGAMLHRLLERKLVDRAQYTGVDVDPELVKTARAMLPGWAQRHGWSMEEPCRSGCTLTGPDGQRVGVRQVTAEARELETLARSRGPWQVLIAASLFDLLDLPNQLESITRHLAPGALLYAPVTFAGRTEATPAHHRDEEVFRAYHESMRERNGTRASGDRAVEELRETLVSQGATILEEGSSNWEVMPSGQPGDPDTMVASRLLDFIRDEAQSHPSLHRDMVRNWIDERRDQLRRGRLVLRIANRDLLARLP